MILRNLLKIKIVSALPKMIIEKNPVWFRKWLDRIFLLSFSEKRIRRSRRVKGEILFQVQKREEGHT